MEKLELILLILVILHSIPLNESQCGIPQQIGNELSTKGSHDTVLGEWPWHTAIYHKSPEKRTYEYACGGTLISEHFVLTAAHCVVVSNGFTIAKNRIFVRLGVLDLDVVSPESFQQHNVQQIHVTGNYPRPSQSRRDDIALIELESSALLTDYVKPACINQDFNLTGMLGTAIGWGVTDDDTIPAVLKKIEMPVVDTYTCLNSDRDLFGLSLDRGILCAGFQNGTNVCNGDSGGGLFFKQAGAWHVGGITSFSTLRNISHHCSIEGFAAFTNVYHFLPWIYEITKLDKSVRLNLLPEDCGESIVDRVPQGNYTRVFAYPWMAQLYFKFKGKTVHGCDGTLINNRYVLTSAICLVYEFSEGLTYVILGEQKGDEDGDCNIVRDSEGVEIERKCAEPVEYAYVKSFEAHPEYRGEPELVNDIGLVRLKKPVIMKDHIRPICLPVPQELRTLQLDRYVVVSWGHSSKYSYRQVEATVPWVNNTECRKEWEVANKNATVADTDICVRDQVDTPCIAYGGTPLGFTVNYNGERFVQFGVRHISRLTANCTSNSVPSIYSGVGSHMDWIMATIKP